MRQKIVYFLRMKRLEELIGRNGLNVDKQPCSSIMNVIIGDILPTYVNIYLK